MKKILMAVAMIVVVTAAFANNKEVSPAVQNAFKTRFPKAMDVEWTVGGTYYKASFASNGTILFAFYNEKAQLIGIMRNISSSQLPISLQGKLAKYNSHYWIADLFEMSNDRGTNYYLTLQDADNKMILKSDCNDWKLLSIKTGE